MFQDSSKEFGRDSPQIDSPKEFGRDSPQILLKKYDSDMKSTNKAKKLSIVKIPSLNISRNSLDLDPSIVNIIIETPVSIMPMQLSRPNTTVDLKIKKERNPIKIKAMEINPLNTLMSSI